MSETKTGRGALFIGGLAAILASTCCLGPLVLITLGFSGAWISNLTVMVKGCRMSAPTRRTNECSRPFRADVGQPLQGGNRVGCR